MTVVQWRVTSGAMAVADDSILILINLNTIQNFTRKLIPKLGLASCHGEILLLNFWSSIEKKSLQKPEWVRRWKQKGWKKMYALHVISITYMSIIGLQLCLTLTVFLPQRYSLIKLNELRFGLDLYMYIYIYIFSESAISRFWRFLGRI